MRKEIKTKQVEVKTEVWTCDFCDYTTKDNRTDYGHKDINTCEVCEDDFCKKHGWVIYEDGDYPTSFLCQDCYPFYKKGKRALEKLQEEWEKREETLTKEWHTKAKANKK